MKSVVIFGGTGFIGTHLAQTLLAFDLAETIFLVDFKLPSDLPYAARLQSALRSGKVVYVEHDVRRPVASALLPQQADVIFNLAAVHREPGHAVREYFETNLLGAENVCAWARDVGCGTIVFTSSISPYGPSEESKTEESLPIPETAYGSSKLAAEKIHLAWQSAGMGRQLLVLRPGVVFGPGEGGNVTRLVRSLMKGYFVYLGNRSTIKAAGYVKELCLVALFAVRRLKETGAPFLLVNFTMDPPPTMEQMVQAILKAGEKRRRPVSVPRSLLLALSYPLSGLGRLLRVSFPIDPVRVRKLIRSNNVLPEQLRSLNYEYTYTLESAFRDWKQDAPEDFASSRLPEPVLPSPAPEEVKWPLTQEEPPHALLPGARKI